jgi:hypothetical protein
MTETRFSEKDIERLKATALEMTKAGWSEQTVCRAMANSVGMAWDDLAVPEQDYVLMLIRGTLMF